MVVSRGGQHRPQHRKHVRTRRDRSCRALLGRAGRRGRAESDITRQNTNKHRQLN